MRAPFVSRPHPYGAIELQGRDKKRVRMGFIGGTDGADQIELKGADAADHGVWTAP
jgi:hypothetical protein